MNKTLKILALISARGGSKGIPRKNITPIATALNIEAIWEGSQSVIWSDALG